MQRIFAIPILILATLGVHANAQESAVPPSTPQVERVLTVPPIAPDFHPEQRPLPELGRVGVDLDRQRPLALSEALALALENNKDRSEERRVGEECRSGGCTVK